MFMSDSVKVIIEFKDIAEVEKKNLFTTSLIDATM